MNKLLWGTKRSDVNIELLGHLHVDFTLVSSILSTKLIIRLVINCLLLMLNSFRSKVDFSATLSH